MHISVALKNRYVNNFIFVMQLFINELSLQLFSVRMCFISPYMLKCRQNGYFFRSTLVFKLYISKLPIMKQVQIAFVLDSSVHDMTSNTIFLIEIKSSFICKFSSVSCRGCKLFQKQTNGQFCQQRNRPVITSIYFYYHIIADKCETIYVDLKQNSHK